MLKTFVDSGLLELVGSGLIAALGTLAAQGVRLLSAHIKREYWRNVTHRLQVAAMNAVKDVYQTYVNAIKAANADGVLTAAEQAEAKKRAIEAAKAYLGAKGISEVIRVLGIEPGALDALIGKEVEAAVWDTKLATSAVKASASRP